MDEVRLVEVKQEIMADNVMQSDELRNSLKKKGTFLINLMSSPGAGKTSFILKTIEYVSSNIRMGVIEADIDSKVDAEKIAAHGVQAVQVRTGGFCHMDANMVTKGVEALDLDGLDLVILENVGNLVCPAEFDTGAFRNIMLLSVPEGDDKPLKYPLMFSVADVLIIHKTDCLELSDFDLVAAAERARRLNPKIKIFEVSSKTGQGHKDWSNWLLNEINCFQN